MKLWTQRYDAETDTAHVEEVDCPNGRFPARDANGEIVYDNSHFDTRDQALAYAEREAAAWITLAAHEVKQAREALRCAEGKAAVAVLRSAAVQRLAREIRK